MKLKKAKLKSKDSVWIVLLKVVVAVGTALLGILGGTEVYASLLR